MRGNEFSLQLDEATTSTSNKDAHLIYYVRFIDNDNNIVEDLLFVNLQQYCRRFNILNKLFSTWIVCNTEQFFSGK